MSQHKYITNLIYKISGAICICKYSRQFTYMQMIVQ